MANGKLAGWARTGLAGGLLVAALATLPPALHAQEEAAPAACERCKGSGRLSTVCAACKGTGDCDPCAGTGKRTSGLRGSTSLVICLACRGTGDCPACKGSGAGTAAGPCPACRGTGHVLPAAAPDPSLAPPEPEAPGIVIADRTPSRPAYTPLLSMRMLPENRDGASAPATPPGPGPAEGDIAPPPRPPRVEMVDLADAANNREALVGRTIRAQAVLLAAAPNSVRLGVPNAPADAPTYELPPQRPGLGLAAARMIEKRGAGCRVTVVCRIVSAEQAILLDIQAPPPPPAP